MKTWVRVALGLGAVVLGGGVFYFMTKRRSSDLVGEFLNVGRRAGYQNERLPLTLVVEAIQSENTWIPALFIGVANWGVQWPAGMVPPRDPLGNDWRGRPLRSGKHQQDGTERFPYGGLGLPHVDSGWLTDILRRHAPPLYQVVGDMRFNPILESPYRRDFLQWASEWLTPANERLLVDQWKARTWNESAVLTGNVRKAIANSRIRNSTQRLADQVARLSAEEQLQRYSTSDRRVRQANNVRRLLLIYDLVQSGQLDGIQMRGIFPLP